MASEADIIKDVLAGNRESFSALIRLYQNKIFALCISLLGSANEAEDAVQDIFVKAYKNLCKFRFESSFSTWIYRIAYNRCLDILREKQKQKQCNSDINMAEIPNTEVSADDREIIEKSLAKMPLHYRSILVMREVNGMSYEKIAEALDISVEAVSSKLWRARAMFSEIARSFLSQIPSKGKES